MSDTIDNFPFFIATERRTGSHLLMNLLRNNARFGLIDVFKPNREFNDIEITDIFNHFLSLRNDQDAHWGLKLYSTGISTVNRYSELIGNPPLKWIFLRRKDKLAQALSRVRQKMTNISHLRRPNTEKNITELRNLEVVPSPENIQLVMIQMIQFCKREIRWFDFFKENGIQPLEIFYEDFMEEKDRKETVTKILDYLEMDYTSSIDSSTQYIRTSPTILPSIYEKIKGEIQRYDR